MEGSKVTADEIQRNENLSHWTHRLRNHMVMAGVEMKKPLLRGRGTGGGAGDGTVMRQGGG